MGIYGSTNDEIVQRLHRFVYWWGSPGVTPEYTSPQAPRAIPPTLHWVTSVMNVAFTYGSFSAQEHEGYLGCFSDCGNSFSASIPADGENPIVDFDDGQQQPYFPTTINELVIGAYFETVAFESDGLRLSRDSDCNSESASSLLAECTDENLVWRGRYFSSGAEVLHVWLADDVLLIESAHGETPAPSIQAVQRAVTSLGIPWIESICLGLGSAGAYTTVILRQHGDSEVEGLMTQSPAVTSAAPAWMAQIRGGSEHPLIEIFDTSAVMPWLTGLTFGLDEDAWIGSKTPQIQRTNRKTKLPWGSVSSLFGRVVESCVINLNFRDSTTTNGVIFFYRGSPFGHHMTCTDGVALAELRTLVIATALVEENN
jgi:hypothetical protein